MEKSITCCFTGHRPKSLPWSYAEKGKRFRVFRKALLKDITQSVEEGYVNFISGMALGVDIISAEIIIKLKKKHPNIKLECAIPCLNQYKTWADKDIKRYHNILKNADKITYVSQSEYFNGCMQKRNLYMIEQASLLIAVFNGTSGGTKSTIDLAQKKQLKTIFIKP